MITSSLDTIVRSILLRKRVSLHYYLDALISSRDCLRELTQDLLNVINTTKAVVDDFGCIEIPDGAAEIVGVGIQSGQNISFLTTSNGINPLQDLNSSFEPQRYDQASTLTDSPPVIYGYFPHVWGWGGWRYADTYKVVKERNQIQLNESLDVEEAFVTYIGDGRSADAATHVEVAAEAAIESYILYQFKENSRSYSDSESERMRQLYLNQVAILRARKSDLSIATLRRIANKNTWNNR